MTSLYQWLQDRATSFRALSAWSQRETRRTEITVQVDERTLVVCSHGPPGMAVCPLCGQSLLTPAPTQGLSTLRSDVSPDGGRSERLEAASVKPDAALHAQPDSTPTQKRRLP